MKPLRVLLVDNEPDILNLLKEEFSAFQIPIDLATSGNAAWEMVQKLSYNIVISDVKMANGDGVDLLNRIRDRNKDEPKFFFMSSYLNLEIDQLFDLGADGFFAKPFDSTTMRQSLQRAMKPSRTLWSTSAPDYVSAHLKKDILDLASAIDKKMISFGRGGFFWSQEQDLPVLDTIVRFTLNETRSRNTLSGCARVKWVRPKSSPGRPAGVGLEIYSLDANTLEIFIEKIEAAKVAAFIPLA